MTDSNDLNRYSKSLEQLTRAEKVIPLGSQTFSKSKTQYPVGISPLFVEKANGAEIWDIDGNNYVDLVSALASVTLGYGDKQVKKAVKKQLKHGVSLSLPTVLESEVAELICRFVPSAEMVRFGKNGSDATSAAIRLARAFTGRDHVIVCGYHGWQDWFIGSTTRNKGVPENVRSLTHTFKYNDIESLRNLFATFPGDIAAVIMEPMNITYPIPNFLESVKTITAENKALLVFDETITGFRFANGGAQSMFGVVPDISTFGKGLANGFPLSAVVGRREIMMQMEEIFFSGTFGGELLSLTAAKSVLERYQIEDVPERLAETGRALLSGVNDLILKFNLKDVLSLTGHPSWVFLNWKGTEIYSADQIRTLFMQEMFRNGVLILGTHNVTLAMDSRIIGKILKAYEKSLLLISQAIDRQDLETQLKVTPLKPLFQVR
jgi:glutamate-1-semialdehyde 2,1-aminomutase